MLNGKTWQVCCSGKRKYLDVRFEGVQRGFLTERKGRSFHVERPKTEKAREPKVESLVRGIWRLRVSEAERRAKREQAWLHRETLKFKQTKTKMYIC